MNAHKTPGSRFNIFIPGSAVFKSAFFALILLAAFAQAGPLYQWTWKLPRVQPHLVLDATAGPSGFLALAEHGTLLYSSDGLAWTARTIAVHPNVQKIRYGGGIFVGIGNDGRIISSTDTTNWTTTAPISGEGWNELEYINNQFLVASGESGKILLSSNGVNWVEAEELGSYGSQLAFGQGNFVALKGSSLYTSTNGTNWIPQPLTLNGSVADVAYGNGKFVAAGAAIHTSTNGLDWESRFAPTGNYLAQVIYAGDKFFAVGHSGTILTSTNGDHWRRETSNAAESFTTISFYNGIFVAGGHFGMLMRSTNGATWEVVQEPWTSGAMSDSVYGDGKVVFVRGYKDFQSPIPGKSFLYSANLTDWHTGGPEPAFEGRIAFGNNIFVKYLAYVLETYGNDLSGPISRYSSGFGSVNPQPFSVAYGNGRFVAPAVWYDSHSLISTNGTNWTAISTTGPKGGLLAFGNEEFLVLQSTNVSRSPDGVRWNHTPIQLSSVVNSMVWGNGRWVAVGNDAYIVSSTDAQTWTVEQPPLLRNFNDVAFGGGLFVAVGTGGAVISSPNGVEWSAHQAITSYDLDTIVYAYGTFLTSGGGAIFQSGIVGLVEPLIVSETGSRILLPSDPFRLSTADTGGLTYQWLKEGQPIAGATQSIYEVSSGLPSQSGSYSVIVIQGTNSMRSQETEVLISPQGASELSIEKLIGVTLRGQAGETYQIEARRLVEGALWIPVQTVTLTESQMTWVDYIWNESEKRIYRAVFVP